MDPTIRFLGYKCPFEQCDIIALDHDMCRGIKQRIEIYGGNKLPDDKWFDIFKFNWNAFQLKSPNCLSER